MPWLWTDELAARLVGTGLVDDDRLDSWVDRPMAVRLDDPTDRDAVPDDR